MKFMIASEIRPDIVISSKPTSGKSEVDVITVSNDTKNTTSNQTYKSVSQAAMKRMEIL